MSIRKPRPNADAKYLPHLDEPIDAYQIARLVKSTYTGAESALRGMERRGLVRKIVRRLNGEFLPHHWVRL